MGSGQYDEGGGVTADDPSPDTLSLTTGRLSQGRKGGGGGGRTPSGHTPLFLGTPKLHKKGKNVTRIRAKTPRFST